MKKFFIFLLTFIHCFIMYSQKRISDEPSLAFSDAVYVNGTFVKSAVGFSLITTEGYHLSERTDLEKPLVINGITYTGRRDIKCDKKINFVTLDDLRKEYAPNMTGKVIYMINEYVITKDEQSYKLDKDFIHCCELLKSSDFDIFKDSKMNFSILRVYTKRYVMARIRIRGTESTASSISK